MNSLWAAISAQFGNPHGVIGSVVSRIQNVLNSAMYRKTAALVNVRPEEKLLEIGYGNGHLLKMLDRKTQADLYGIDISADAKAMAGKRNRRAAAAGRLHLTVGDCGSLPYEENCFSAVTSINTIYFWRDPEKGMSEVFRVLKPGKPFYNVVVTKEALDTIPFTAVGYRKYEIEELSALGKRAGFARTEVIEIQKNRSYAVVYIK